MRRRRGGRKEGQAVMLLDVRQPKAGKAGRGRETPGCDYSDRATLAGVKTRFKLGAGVLDGVGGD